MMEDNKYNTEKVLYKTKSKIILPDKKTEETDCFITENHVVIESDEPIKIPLSCIETCRITHSVPAVPYSTQVQKPVEPMLDTITLIFFDELRKKHKLSIEMRAGDGFSFDSALTSAIQRAKKQWYASLAIEKNWFQRHLNWTVILSGVATNVLLLVIAFTESESLFWVIYSLCIIALFVVAGWALRQKNRSLWWLFIFFVPFGWIVFLCLENRRHLIELSLEAHTK